MADKTKIKIAFLSTYPPRKCGIATFTKSFVRIFDEFYVQGKTKVIAVSDELEKYDYSDRVIYEIDQFDPQSYASAAEYINASTIEIVALQHEYGIFGGQDGKYILKFLENVNKPVVTSLHSVLKEHSETRQKLTQRILDLSDTVVVMTNNAKKILVENFKIDPDKIKIILHGVPNVRFDEKEKAKKALGLKGKTVISTFGLINRGKGIERALEAIAKVTNNFPEIVYLIIGVTHPNVIKQEGESYRKSLMQLVQKKKIEPYVSFVNRYLKYQELVDYLKATDIYLAPQLDLNQAFSGTLSYALGCGCAAISSPTNYAREILANNRGLLTEPDPELIASALTKLLRSPSFCQKIQIAGYKFARKMIWPRVGSEYLKILESVLYLEKEKWKKRLPNFNERPSIKYLVKLTDDFGIIQHSQGTNPDLRFGYSLDDQARGIIVCTKYLKHFSDPTAQKLLHIYLKYLKNAVDENLIIHNFFDQNRTPRDKVASDDSIARGCWALAYLLQSKILNPQQQQEVKKLLAIYQSRSNNNFVKPISYNLLGFSLLKTRPEVTRLANILVKRYQEYSRAYKWHWFEEKLSWANAIVVYALIKAYQVTKKNDYLTIALKSLAFLETNCLYKNIPAPIGQDGWYYLGGKRALYDQQAIDAADMVILFNELYKMTKDPKYQKKARYWMGWFFGNNLNESILYDNISKGVYDGLTRRGVNKNEGAESILVYLMAYLSFQNGL